MAKLFKGIKQVTNSMFQSAVQANEATGYIWFVRTEVLGEGEDTNLIANDEYDIYFGKTKYGHFREGELDALRSALDVLRSDLGFAPGAFTFGEGVTTLQGAFESIQATLTSLGELTAEHTTAIETNANNIKGLQDELSTYLVKSVESNDKVLTVADGILSSSIDLKYENDRISLLGKGGEEIAGFDASAFVKDSVLEDVEVVTIEGEKYIEFTWKTEGESTKTDKIKVTDFAKFYEAGTALDLESDGTFNVKVAVNDNFLSVNDSNELIVDDITTDKTMLKEAITIEGGPLATDAVKGAFADGVIPAGTDIQTVLKALLCVEIYPVPTKNTPDYTVSITAPSVTASGVSNNALVEVGQKITFNAVTATSVSVSKTQPIVSGFTHGYSTTLGGDVVSNTSISGAWTINQKINNVYELSAETSGFTGNKPTTVQNADNTKCQLASCELTAILGTNTYKVTEDAPKFVGSYTGVDTKYVVSNLGGTSEEHKSVNISASTSDIEKDPENKSTTFTVTGVYPVYTNGVAASTNDADGAAMSNLANPVGGDGTKLALMKSGTAFAVSFANQSLAPYKLYLPGEWKVSSAKAINPNTAKYDVECKNDFKANGTVTIKVQNIDVTYTVYEWASTEGPNRVKFTVA